MLGQTLYGNHSMGIKAPQTAICGAGANYSGQLGFGYTSAFENEFNCTAGIIETFVPPQDSDSGILLYPNPSKGELHISFKNGKASPARILMYNAMGALLTVSDISEEDHVMDCSAYPKGVYSLVIERAGQRIVKKFVLE